MAALVALGFFGLDLLAVVLALAWLSRRRAMSDMTDMRHRDPRRWFPPGER